MAHHEQENYMFFKNLEQIMRQATMLYQMDHSMLDQILQQGHDWADDHVSVAKENMDQVFDFIMNKTKEVPVPTQQEMPKELDFITVENKVMDFNSYVKINEDRDIDDPRNNQINPEETVKSVLDIWDNSDPDQKTSELIKEYEDNGFSVKTLHEISEEEDIPDNSIIFTYHSDPSDESYYKQGSKIISINMGRLTDEVLDTKDRGFYKAEDGSLEDILGVEFGSNDYEDLIIAVTPNLSEKK